MDEFTFRNVGNSYFMGNDVVATRVRDGREVKINGKDGVLAVNVKDYKHSYGHYTESTLPEGVFAMAEELNAANAHRFTGEDWGAQCWTDVLYERAQETFWIDAKVLAEDAGFNGVGSAGRSGGWCCIDGADSESYADIIMDPEGMADEPEDIEYYREKRSAVLNLLIDIEDLIEDCHGYWYDDIREGHAEFVRLREDNFVRGEN